VAFARQTWQMNAVTPAKTGEEAFADPRVRVKVILHEH
jgi:hypothetical protein